MTKSTQRTCKFHDKTYKIKYLKLKSLKNLTDIYIQNPYGRFKEDGKERFAIQKKHFF